MTDSTTGGEFTAFDVGPSIDELFDAVREEPLEPESVDRTDDGRDEEFEDRTASEVFDQFRREADGQHDADGVLGDVSPDDIITGAAEDEPVPADNDLLDEDALDNLLLTGRREEDEFLWVDTDDDDKSDGAEEKTDQSEGDGPEVSTTDSDEPTPGDRDEVEPELEETGEPESAGPDEAERESQGTDGTEPEGSERDAGETEPDGDRGDSSGLLGRVRSRLGL